jgi:hypothetical protein
VIRQGGRSYKPFYICIVTSTDAAAISGETQLVRTFAKKEGGQRGGVLRPAPSVMLVADMFRQCQFGVAQALGRPLVTDDDRFLVIDEHPTVIIIII